MNKQQLEYVLAAIEGLVSDDLIDATSIPAVAISMVKKAIADYDKPPSEEFKQWFDDVWMGDGQHGQSIPTSGTDYDKYLLDYQLAHGAWQAALASILANQPKRVPMSDADIEFISKTLDFIDVERPFKANGELDADKYAVNVYRVLVRAIEKHHGVTE